MTHEERASAMEMLRGAEREFLEAVENLSDAQWNYKETPERWSMGEVAEHLVLSEDLLFDRARRALEQDASPDGEAKTIAKNAMLPRLILDRQYKAQAPELIRPSGTVNRSEILHRYREARARTLAFVEKTELPLEAHTWDHPFPVFGTLNAYQWLIYIPLHNLRHNQQITEIKTGVDFPG